MDDFERYGDYNEVDESPVKKKSPILFMIKLTAIFITLFVVTIISLRVILFNYYPSDFKKIYVDDKLVDAFHKNGGELDAVKQILRFGYDDPDLGNFMSEEVILVRDIDRIQITIRLNVSSYELISEKYGISKDLLDSDDTFSFKLFRNNLKSDTVTDPTVSDVNGEYTFYNEDVVGRVEKVETDSFLMYRYFRIIIDDVDLDGVGNDDIAQWLSLAIYVNGSESTEPYSRLLIYENNETYSTFEELEIKEGDLKR